MSKFLVQISRPNFFSRVWRASALEMGTHTGLPAAALWGCAAPSPLQWPAARRPDGGGAPRMAVTMKMEPAPERRTSLGRRGAESGQRPALGKCLSCVAGTTIITQQHRLVSRVWRASRRRVGNGHTHWASGGRWAATTRTGTRGRTRLGSGECISGCTCRLRAHDDAEDGRAATSGESFSRC